MSNSPSLSAWARCLKGMITPVAWTVLATLQAMPVRAQSPSQQAAGLAEEQADVTTAQRVLHVWRTQKPNDPDAVLLEADLLVKQHQLDAALEIIRDSLKTEPGNSLYRL